VAVGISAATGQPALVNEAPRPSGAAARGMSPARQPGRGGLVWSELCGDRFPGQAPPAGSEPVNLATGQVSGTGPAGAEARAPPAARLRRPADKID